VRVSGCMIPVKHVPYLPVYRTTSN